MSTKYILNETTCYARKAQKGSGFLEQCPNKKKPDSNYCGKHTNCKNPFIDLIEKQNTNNVLAPSVEIPRKTKELRETKIIQDIEEIQQKVFDKDKYKNKTDFYTLEDIETIPLNFFYELQENNQYFAFDIRTLYDYIQSCNPLEPIKNPYTNLDFTKEVLEDIRGVHTKISKKTSMNEYKEEVNLDPLKKLEWRVLEVFQKVNELGHYVEYKWFWELSLGQLKRLYFELEDLWNYRLFLTYDQKKKILPNYAPFVQYTVNIFNKITDINVARKVLIGEIERFITMGKPEGKNGNDNKYTGSIIVLTALVEVSPKAAQNLPHLVPQVV